MTGLCPSFGVSEVYIKGRGLDLELSYDSCGGTKEAMISPAFAVDVLGVPSIVRSLRLRLVPSIAYPTMCVGSNGRSSR